MQFLTSRVSTPVPFRPKRVDSFTPEELAALDQLQLSSKPGSGSNSPASTNGNFKDNIEAQKVDVELLEKKVNGTA